MFQEKPENPLFSNGIQLSIYSKFPTLCTQIILRIFDLGMQYFYHFTKDVIILRT